MSQASQEPIQQQVSYFQERMELLGITPESNKISLHKTELGTGKDILEEVPIFKEVELGIEILVYTLDRYTIRIEKPGSKQKKNFSMTRLKVPIQKDGDTIKYLIPKGAGTYPFIPPQLLEKYERKDQVHTLFLVEGYFKAFKASMAGADIIGLSSITHMKDKERKSLHPDIKTIIEKCNVQRIVWLTDGDALDITNKELTEDIDLYKRPNGFFRSVETFKTLLSDFHDLDKWFVHIDIDNIRSEDNTVMRDEVKGIDDLLIRFADRQKEIIEDMYTVARQGKYFQKFNVSFGLSKVLGHFRLSNPKDFYLFHVERRPELKDREFKFNGTRYKYDEDKGECKIVIPSEARSYFRVGDEYYKYISVPNQHQKMERQIQVRRKTTIEDDHGKNFLKHVPKYETFCNLPSHTNFQPVVYGCFNVYSPMDFTPEDEQCTEEDCPTIIGFIRHIFGDKLVSYTDKTDGKKKEYSMFEMGLDYMQILYQQPTQKLPILCLVSRENNTGKTTMGDFLRMMLGANTAIVGNADLAGDFNAHWASKSVVVCDETKIDKQHVIEKIKMLSTAKKIFMNAKGRGQVELDCFIKFVLITNNEETFISASDDDIRYWVIKVPVLQSENPKILDAFIEEMPAFLSFLNRRSLKTEHRNRMWFSPALLKTDALRKLIEQSQPAVEKEIRHFMKELFLDTGYQEVRMTATVIHKEVFRNAAKYDIPYLSRILKDRIKVEAVHVWMVEGNTVEYDTDKEALAVAAIQFKDVEGFMLQGKIKKHYKVTRYTYPRVEEIVEAGKKEFKRVDVADNGRPFLFLRRDFVTHEEDSSIDIGKEARYINSMTPAATLQPIDNSLPF